MSSPARWLVRSEDVSAIRDYSADLVSVETKDGDLLVMDWALVRLLADRGAARERAGRGRGLKALLPDAQERAAQGGRG